MRALLTCATAALLAGGATARAHTVTPMRQIVRTLDERGVAHFQMANGRKGVNRFEVEIFDLDWRRSEHATPIQPIVVAPPMVDGDADHESGARPFSVMVDLAGSNSRSFFVCTKSLNAQGGPRRAVVNTRVCGKLTMERY